MGRNKERTSEFKAKVVLEVISGHKSQAEACREYKISKPLLQLWTNADRIRANTIDKSKNHESDSGVSCSPVSQEMG
jgi:transposase-like protein